MARGVGMMIHMEAAPGVDIDLSEYELWTNGKPATDDSMDGVPFTP